MGQTNDSNQSGVAAMAVTWSKESLLRGDRPGYIGTEMVLTMKSEALEKIPGIPAKRLGQPDEIAKNRIYPRK